VYLKSAQMSDVIIVGGGVAGSALAILLGRQGFRVELFEQRQFPKEKPCGEGLMPAGVAVLQRMDLVDAVGGAPFYGVRYHAKSFTVEGAFPSVHGAPTAGRGQRRKHLDEVLFRTATATPGVTTHLGTRVERLLFEDGRVVGVMAGGATRYGGLVVAADGIHSRTRHLLGLDAPRRRKRFAVLTHFRFARGKEQPPWVDVFLARGHELYVTPLPDHEVLVAALADAGNQAQPVEKTFSGWWSAEPLLAARLAGARRVSPLQCVSPLAARAKCGVARGIILLGDAAGFLDPITGGGMAHALMTAELLTSRLRQVTIDQDDWIWDFERDRRALLRDYRLLTESLQWLSSHRTLAAGVFSLLSHAPSVLSHFVGVAGGVRQLFRPWSDGNYPARVVTWQGQTA
jgi:menaquinone-9 beta-reductase